MNPIMQGMAAALTPEDMKALGVYYSQQKPKGHGGEGCERSSRRGRSSIAAATWRPACPRARPATRPNGAGIPKNYPRLAGQYADYTYAQLKAFKAGERGADKDGKDANGRDHGHGRREDDRRADESRRPNTRPACASADRAGTTSPRRARHPIARAQRSSRSPRIAALNVYPVKSCRGIGSPTSAWPRAASSPDAVGAVGDREWMIVDRDGRFVTQREHPAARA